MPGIVLRCPREGFASGKLCLLPFDVELGGEACVLRSERLLGKCWPAGLATGLVAVARLPPCSAVARGVMPPWEPARELGPPHPCFRRSPKRSHSQRGCVWRRGCTEGTATSFATALPQAQRGPALALALPVASSPRRPTERGGTGWALPNAVFCILHRCQRGGRGEELVAGGGAASCL